MSVGCDFCIKPVYMAIKSQQPENRHRKTLGEKMLDNRRVRVVDRRQQQRKLNGEPFKDSNGVTVREERRFIPDRRVNSIAAESDEQEPKTA